MAGKALNWPGKAHRTGFTLITLMKMIPDEETVTRLFVAALWNGDRCCGHCGSLSASELPNAKPMPY